MRGPSKIFVIGGVVVLAAVGGQLGCGGSASEAPVPVTAHFDETAIAGIAVDQQQPVVTAQNAWLLAKRESAKADADLAEANAQVEIVHIDQQVAKLNVDAATIGKKSADSSADTGRISQATKDLHNAGDLATAADQRAKYVEAYHGYLQQVARAAQATMYWREAQFELAKAQLGQKTNRQPQGVNYDDFPKQEQDRGKRAADARTGADSAKQRAMEARDGWLKAQENADRETGRPTSFPDPLSPNATAAAGGSAP